MNAVVQNEQGGGHSGAHSRRSTTARCYGAGSTWWRSWAG